MSAVAMATLPPCTRCDAPVEADDLWCPVCLLALPAPAGASRTLSPVQARATIVRCDGCGAGVTYSAEVQAPRCAFCGSVMHLEQPEDPVQQADSHLPFALSPEEAKDAVRQWLRTRGFFRPNDLHTGAAVEQLKAVLWPAWRVDASCEVSWTADTDQGAQLSAWAPASGSTRLSFSRLVLPASQGLSNRECMELIPAFDFRSLRPLSLEDRTHVALEAFEVQRSVARRRIVDALHAQALQDVQAQLPGTRHRHVQVSLLLRSLRTDRLALPTYVLAYRYRHKLYRVVVHGQRADTVLGQSPLSPWKIAGVIAAGLFAVTLGVWMFFAGG